MAKKILTHLDMQNAAKLLNLPDPTSAQEAATKSFTEAKVAAAEANAAAALATETAARQAADSAEQSAREAAVLDLQGQIDALETSSGGALAAETAARIAADSAIESTVSSNYTTLSGLISSEESARIAAVSAVQSQLDSEVAALEAADGVLQAAITAEESARIAAVSAETTARLTADSDLQDQIDQEIVDRAAAVSAEAALRVSGDAATLVSANLYTDGRETAITSAYTSAIATAKSEAISTAGSYTDQKVADLVNSAPALLDTLKELADAIGSDANFATTITTQIGVVDSKVDQEISDRAAAVSAEAAARVAADQDLQDAIDAEAAARIAATAHATTTFAGVAEVATQAEVDAGSVTDKFVTPETLAGYAYRIKKFAQAVGDGSATQIDVTHGLASNDVQVQVYRAGSPFDTVECDMERLSSNVVRLKFLVAPTSGEYRVVVIG